MTRSTTGGAEEEAVVSTVVAFPVTNPGEPEVRRTVRGRLYLPRHASECRGVQLLFHGFSYGAWAWDPPGFPRCSYARAMALAGYPVVAVDLLGYGESDRPDGYTISTEGYGDMAHQMVGQLRAGAYQGETVLPFERVIVGGHSAGGEVARLEAGRYHDVDGLIVMSMADAVTPEAGQAFFESNIPMAASSDYVEPFFGSPDLRLHLFYESPTLGHKERNAEADPEVMALDRRMANPTPSGQIQTTPLSPSKAVIGAIDVPVLLLLAELDKIVPASEAESEPGRYQAAHDVTTIVLPRAGHSFFLHRNAPESFTLVCEWLTARPDIAPRCLAG